jgi:hypothetical protein
METYSVHYGFSQHFDFSPEEAFRWCTDYAPGDLELMGEKGRRKVKRLNDDTFVLNDKYKTKEGKVVRKKLVRIYPERLSWTNTRVSKDGRYSQFLYQIAAEDGGGSRLDFSGSQIFSGKKPGNAKLESMAKQLVTEDSASWRNLAKEMAKDLSK